MTANRQLFSYLHINPYFLRKSVSKPSDNTFLFVLQEVNLTMPEKNKNACTQKKHQHGMDQLNAIAWLLIYQLISRHSERHNLPWLDF